MNTLLATGESRRARATIIALMFAATVLVLLLIPGTAEASTVKFVSDSTAYGTVSKASASISDGKKIGSAEPTVKVKDGYRFDGWYLNGAKIGTSLKNQTVTKAVTYRAHFTKARVSSQNHSGAKALDTMGLVVDRYIKQQGKPEGIILANAGTYKDALSASALAGATGYPVVLTASDELSAQAAKRIKSSGAYKIVVIGGEKAVSKKTAASALSLAKANAKGAKVYTTSGEAKAATASLKRHWGSDAIATANDVYNDNKTRWGSTIVIATGDSFKDALSISPFCYKAKAPILLVKDASLTSSTKKILQNAASSGSADSVVIVGGNKVVSTSTESYLKGLFGSGNVTRLAGGNCYGTSLAVAKWLVGKQGFSDNLVGFATGEDYRDAVVAGPLQGASNAPLVLVADSPAGKVGERWFVKRALYNNARFFGGKAAVSQGIRDEVELHLVPTDIPKATTNWTGSGTLAIDCGTYCYATSSRLSTVRGLLARGTYPYRVCDGGWVAVQQGKEVVYLTPTSWYPASYASGSKWELRVAKGKMAAYGAPSTKARVINSSWRFAYAVHDARKLDSKLGDWYAVKDASGKQIYYVKGSQLRTATEGESLAHKVMKNNNYFNNDLKKAFNWTKNHKYRHIDGNNYGSTKWAEKYAADFFKRNNGNCYSFAAAFCYLARQLGYDAQVHAGYVPSAAGGAAPHGWVEIKKNGKTYVCDPELAYEIPSRNWYMNTYASAPVSYTR